MLEIMLETALISKKNLHYSFLRHVVRSKCVINQYPKFIAHLIKESETGRERERTEH